MKEKIHVSPAHISFNDTSSSSNYKTTTIHITNLSEETVYLSIKNIQSYSIQTCIMNTKLTSPTVNNTTHMNIEFYPSEFITILPTSTGVINASIVIPRLNQYMFPYEMYGGYISIRDYVSDKALTNVPYFGILGEMKDAPLFDEGYPYLASYRNTTEKLKQPFIFNLKEKQANMPVIVLRLLFGAVRLEVKVLGGDGKAIGYMSRGIWRYTPKNSLKAPKYIIPWNGIYISPLDEVRSVDMDEVLFGNKKEVKAENGTFYLLSRALKHFGNPEDKNDWEEWKSIAIVVQN